MFVNYLATNLMSQVFVNYGRRVFTVFGRCVNIVACNVQMLSLDRITSVPEQNTTCGHGIRNEIR